MRFGGGILLTLTIAGAGALGATDAETQIPGADGVIHACVRMDRDGSDGKLARLVGENEACKRNETRVRWHVTGPRGETGVTGAAGAQGETGLTGLQGPQGPPGPAAAAGAISGQLASCVPGATLDGYLVHISGRAFTAITGADGAFQFDHVPPGDYDVSVKAATAVSANPEIEVIDGLVTLPVLQQRYTLVTHIQVAVSDSPVTLPNPVQLAACAPPPPPPACETPSTFFRDSDADGFGTSSSTVTACVKPPGFVLSGGDCNDSNSRVNPAALEITNGIDDNCDGRVDEGSIDDQR